MDFTKILRLSILIMMIFISQNIMSQYSKSHYIPPITATDDPGDQWIYISAPPGVNNIKVEVKVGGALGATADSGTVFFSGTVDNFNPLAIELAQNPGNNNGWWSNFFVQSSETEMVLNKGFIVESESEVYVSVRANSDGQQYQAGALVSKGKSGLGTRFRAGMFQNQNSSHIGFISVMASEDLTQVAFNFTKNIETTGGPKTTETPLLVNLNKGESYILASQGGFGNELIGTLVTSNKPVIVNTGSASGSFEESIGGQDYGFDQIVGSDLVGSEYKTRLSKIDEVTNIGG